MRLSRLDRIVSADLLDRGFQRRADFNLCGSAAQSFGVFQESRSMWCCGCRRGQRMRHDGSSTRRQRTVRETDGSLVPLPVARSRQPERQVEHGFCQLPF